MSNEERDGNLGEVIDRRVQVYGDPVAGFAEIATMWSVLFDVEVPAWKVPIAQALMKVVRMKTSPDYSDHSDDIDGYLDIFRKIIGPDMIQARTVNEYIEKKWGAAGTMAKLTAMADEYVEDDPIRFGVDPEYEPVQSTGSTHVAGCIEDHGPNMPCMVPHKRGEILGRGSWIPDQPGCTCAGAGEQQDQPCPVHS